MLFAICCSSKENIRMETDCIFCKIVKGEIPSTFLYENDNLVVFRDINPHAPVHLLIVPKRHIRSVNDLTEDDAKIVSEMIMTAKMMAEKESVSKSGYKLLFNVEKGGGQVIFHLHLHLIGGWKK
uniref:Uncharacterized HIT-like protein aq_141 n=2 Tax=Desulfobacterium TaxID=2295 RepID=E1YD97_9BACT|nr:Uncharacterized HIT-like protein aq_141 [uncultured Desulfobacterium sp.]